VPRTAKRNIVSRIIAQPEKDNDVIRGIVRFAISHPRAPASISPAGEERRASARALRDIQISCRRSFRGISLAASGDPNRYRPWRLEFSGDIVFISSGIPRYANYASFAMSGNDAYMREMRATRADLYFARVFAAIKPRVLTKGIA